MARIAFLISVAVGSDRLPDFDMPFTVDGGRGVVNTSEVRET
jgi:hypothetical protein